jgi:hypothetical protein
VSWQRGRRLRVADRQRLEEALLLAHEIAELAERERAATGSPETVVRQTRIKKSAALLWRFLTTLYDDPTQDGEAGQ